ncbi:MAG: potassium transporter TrkG [Pseudomonadota bacterium]
MPEINELDRARRFVLKAYSGGPGAILRLSPAQLLLLGYLSYILLGWSLLSMPFAQEVPQAAIDTLFIATSAVSTTGLITVDPGTSFTFFGELVIIVLIQFGGLGYMTVSSLAVLGVQARLSGMREDCARATFSLPEGMSLKLFLRSVLIFTVLCEVLGAIILWRLFAAAGEENALWLGIFHAISAFCTAGFSLFSNSLEDYSNHTGVLLVVSALSIAGAMGFLVVVDMWRSLTGRVRHLGFTSKIILRVTGAFLLFGTLFTLAVEPSLAGLPPEEQVLSAFFQVMSASTTVGFNSVPLTGMILPVVAVLLFLMMIGASPAGTGGGIRTTTFAALLGLVRSTTRGRKAVTIDDRRLARARLQTATATLAYYLLVLFVAFVVLLVTERGHAFEVVLFETISAMGTVGLSLGLTGELSDVGKLALCVLMTAGRVGILTFGIAVSGEDETRAEKADNELVL